VDIILGLAALAVFAWMLQQLLAANRG